MKTIPLLGQRILVSLAMMTPPMKQAELARRVPMSRDMLWRVVKHNHSPNAWTIRRIAQITGQSTDWLMGLHDVGDADGLNTPGGIPVSLTR